nr:DUF2938 family protein [Acinetobacter sp. Marseille-Q1620]
MASIDMLLIIQSIIIGTLATFFMDVIAFIRKKYFKTPMLNYALVGRWFLSWKDGRFIHENILQSPSKKFEYISGWLVHYLTGILWAYLYLILNSIYSFKSLFLSVLFFSLCTTLVPFIIMQPALGFGFFASKMPNPLTSIKNSIITHTFFGVGLFLCYKSVSIYFQCF